MPQKKVIGLLNPKILEDRSGKGELSFSIDHPDKIMEMGDSVDCGTCQAKKADGSGCTNLVNKNSCEYCTFHVKRAYQSISSKRGDLQSAFSGNTGVRSRLMDKVASKGQVLFGAGQILNPGPCIQGKMSAKQRSKDNSTLANLGVKVTAKVMLPAAAKKRTGNNLGNLDNTYLTDPEKKAVNSVASGVSEELGKKLLAPTPGSRLLIKHLTRVDRPEDERQKSKDEEAELRKLKVKEHQVDAKKLLMQHKKQLAMTRVHEKLQRQNSVPRLGRGCSSGDFIELAPTKRNENHSRAAAILKMKGERLKKADPNYVMQRNRSDEDLSTSRKRVAEKLSPSPAAADENKEMGRPQEKKAKIIRSFSGDIIDEKRMEELRNKKSANQNLAMAAEMEEEDRYFDKLEKKEAMEEKMLNTKEMAAKVITCSICKYTALSQSEMCKNNGHPVKRICAKKRFFECKNCKKRTICFDKYPKVACGNCKGSSWVKTGMMREKKGPLLDSEKLLIRGREEKFIGATLKSSDLNINL